MQGFMVVTDSIMAQVGTVDIPERVERAQYFRELSYLELSVLFDTTLKESTRDKWAAVAPAGTLGLVAPRAALGARETLDVAPALQVLHDAVARLAASCAVFRSPPLFAPSQAHRDRLQTFFTEVATAERVGCERVWVPDGLWEPRAAVKLATELGVACAFDPLVREPGMPPEIYEDLDAPSLYFRIEALGRAGTIGDEPLEDLAALVEHYEDRTIRIVFASRERWRDARNFKKRLEDG
jgi:hypothetical protein